MIIYALIACPVNAGGNDDLNDKEIGVEWVNKYNGFLPDLSYSDDNALGFCNELKNNGFTAVFNYGDNLAWESDFEREGVGGHDSWYVDNVDFVYFSGHGNPFAFFFGTNHDNDGSYPHQVHYTEADWGDKDLEWLFITACEVLAQYWVWQPAFHTPITLHGITGFETSIVDNSAVGNLGKVFAQCLTQGGCINQSWYIATTSVGLLPPNGELWAAVYAVKVEYTPPPPQPYITVYYCKEFLPGYGSGMYPDPPKPQWGVTVTIEHYHWKVYPWW